MTSKQLFIAFFFLTSIPRFFYSVGPEPEDEGGMEKSAPLRNSIRYRDPADRYAAKLGKLEHEDFDNNNKEREESDSTTQDEDDFFMIDDYDDPDNQERNHHHTTVRAPMLSSSVVPVVLSEVPKEEERASTIIQSGSTDVPPTPKETFQSRENTILVEKKVLEEKRKKMEKHHIILYAGGTVVVMGILGITMIRALRAWWQQRKISGVLEKYGKSISTISSPYGALLVAAYHTDNVSMRHIIDTHGLQNSDCEWIIPVITELYFKEKPTPDTTKVIKLWVSNWLGQHRFIGAKNEYL